MNYLHPHADQGDENDALPPALTAKHPYRPTDVYDCLHRTGHRYVRDLNNHMHCMCCGHRWE